MDAFFVFFMPSPIELAIIGGVILLLIAFLGRYYPSVLRSVGKGVGKVFSDGQRPDKIEPSNKGKE